MRLDEIERDRAPPRIARLVPVRYRKGSPAASVGTQGVRSPVAYRPKSPPRIKLRRHKHDVGALRFDVGLGQLLGCCLTLHQQGGTVAVRQRIWEGLVSGDLTL